VQTNNHHGLINSCVIGRLASGKKKTEYNQGSKKNDSVSHYMTPVDQDINYSIPGFQYRQMEQSALFKANT
jgi:hypothetical protein